LPQDKDKIAVDTVMGYLRKKLPPAIASQLDTILAGRNLSGDITKGLGGLLGGKK
jgi:hypothetical protein